VLKVGNKIECNNMHGERIKSRTKRFDQGTFLTSLNLITDVCANNVTQNNKSAAATDKMTTIVAYLSGRVCYKALKRAPLQCLSEDDLRCTLKYGRPTFCDEGPQPLLWAG